jgi:predicted ATP-grasp superfamily ATP-dependent carboligase
MTTIFLYEHLTAMGAGAGSEPVSAPALLAEGRAMLDAVAEDLGAIPDIRVLTANGSEESKFRELAAQADFSLIIAPESDGILATRCHWVETAGGRLLGPTPAAVQLTADKLALAEHLRGAGIPTPRTWLLSDVPAHSFPIVCKPRDGAGSLRTYFARSAGEASSLHRNNADLIAQEFIAGFAASVAFLIGPRDCVGLAPCAQHLSDDGYFRYMGGHAPLPDDLAARATLLGLRAVNAVEGLRGYVGVDLVLAADPRGDCIIEINPRLTTSYVGLRRLARFNIAEMMLGVVQGDPLPELRWGTGLIEFTKDGWTFANPSC